MGTLIDSSVLIAWEREAETGRPVHTLGGSEEVFVSVISASELLHGVYRARDEGMRNRRAAWVSAVLDSMPLLDVDLSVARTHAQLWADLSRQGKPVGPHDLWLAATAVARGLRLMTLKVREFSRVPGLRVASWPPPID